MDPSKLVFVGLTFALASACAETPTPERHAAPVSVSHTVPLGKPTLLMQGVPYSVAGTDMIVKNRGAHMATVLVNNDPDKESHVFSVELEIMSRGQTLTNEIEADKPLVLNGYRFRAEAEGFTWGQGDGAITVERVR